MAHSGISIFNQLKHQLGDQIPIGRLSKATLVHLSHILEDAVIRDKLPALIFTGFQESTQWRKETKRYEELANVATQTVIFAGEPIPEDADFSGIRIQLATDDSLRQEWFLLILSTRFTVVIAGLDQMEATLTESNRKFEFIWSFDTTIVSQVLDVVSDIISRYRPDLVSQLQQARQNFPLVEVDNKFLLNFVYEMIYMEDLLHNEVARQHLELQKKETQMQLLLSRIPLCMIEVNIDGSIVWISGILSQTLQQEYGFIVGQSIFDIEYEVFGQLADAFTHTLNNPGGKHLLSLEDYETQLVDIPDDMGQTLSIVIVLFDVSERIESETQRIELDKVRELSNLQRQLMITLSHELRSPLTIIGTSSHLLNQYADRIDEQFRQKHLDKIQNQVFRLKTIMDDINAVVNSEKVTFGSDLRWINLSEHCTKIIDDIANAHGYSIHRDVDDSLTNIYTDPRIYQYIITNLLNNSIKYSEDNATISCRIAQDNNMIVIQVSDDGIGIPAEDLKHITESFYRASNAGFTRGTGLGLSIIDNIVKGYGGTTHIESRLGEGTTITIKLETKIPQE